MEDIRQLKSQTRDHYFHIRLFQCIGHLNDSNQIKWWWKDDYTEKIEGVDAFVAEWSAEHEAPEIAVGDTAGAEPIATEGCVVVLTVQLGYVFLASVKYFKIYFFCKMSGSSVRLFGVFIFWLLFFILCDFFFLFSQLLFTCTSNRIIKHKI